VTTDWIHQMLNDYECDCFDIFELHSTITRNTVLTAVWIQFSV